MTASEFKNCIFLLLNGSVDWLAQVLYPRGVCFALDGASVVFLLFVWYNVKWSELLIFFFQKARKWDS